MRICDSNKIPDVPNAAGLGTTLWKPRTYSVHTVLGAGVRVVREGRAQFSVAGINATSFRKPSLM